MNKLETFVLLDKAKYRLSTRIFVRGAQDKKVYAQSITFTTEALVTAKDRLHKARTVSAQYLTNKPLEIEAIYRDTGYGVVFVHKDDPNGERKKEPIAITPDNARMAALKNLFDYAKMEFDASKSYDVLLQEYQIYMSALSGGKAIVDNAKVIPHTPIDVKESISEQAQKARDLYKEKYGKDVPVEFENDLAFLSELGNPDFDPEEYFKEHSTQPTEGSEDLPDDIVQLQALYTQLHPEGKNPPPAYKNNAEWLKGKIKEGQSAE